MFNIFQFTILKLTSTLCITYSKLKLLTSTKYQQQTFRFIHCSLMLLFLNQNMAWVLKRTVSMRQST